MKQLVAIFALLTVLLSIPAGQAMEIPLPERIVIAPAISTIAKALRVQLNTQRQGKVKGAHDLYFFYGGHGFEPLWIVEKDGSWLATAKGQAVAALFEGATSLGLEPLDYTVPAAKIATTEDALAYELAVTSAAMRFAFDNYGGRIDPRSISSNLDMPRLTLPPLGLLQKLSDTDDPAKFLAALAPQDAEFKALLALLTNLDVGPDIVEIAEGGSIKPGAADERVPSLRARLGIPVTGDAPMIYDGTLVAAVEDFQSTMGLTPDGIVGNATRDALNRSGPATREQVLVNLEKWRWLPRERGRYRVEVNIPEYRLWIKRQGESVYETRVVVGTAKNQTPVFYDQIRHVVVNPYWNVPTSIARGEIGPQVRRDPGYLARREFELLSGGTVIDPWSVNWSSVPAGTFPFSLRQKPGVQNALGQVKFLFPNKHDVYLHDTPEKSLFGRDVRAFSHGCVRVQNPFEFAQALLAGEPRFGSDTLVAAFGPRERWFNMEVKVPVYLTYFTLRVDAGGQARSFADLYGHDAKISAALGLDAL